ncbi:MAG: HAD family hydrolase [Verrucomicrobiota bacterium]|nr:HAD family hydrolase [Verrucomicrobiota bacterium]
MIRGVIFDLDGTLVDSNDLHTEAWQETFRHFGQEFSYDKLRHQIGKGGDQYLPMFLDPVEMKRIGPEVEKYRSDLFKSKYLSRVRPFPKVRELFEKLRLHGKKIALASSGSAAEVDHYVKLAEIGALIDAQTAKDNVRNSKPAPDVFLAALNQLDLPAQEAIVVGDTPYDVDAAKKTQLLTIGLLCGGFAEDELRASGAVAIYRDVADLLASYQRSPLA